MKGEAVAADRDRTVCPEGSLLGISGYPFMGDRWLALGFPDGSLLERLADWLAVGGCLGRNLLVLLHDLPAYHVPRISTTIPLQETATLPERLGSMVKSFRYTVEQHLPQSSSANRNGDYSHQYTKLHIQLLDGSVI